MISQYVTKVRDFCLPVLRKYWQEITWQTLEPRGLRSPAAYVSSTYVSAAVYKLSVSRADLGGNRPQHRVYDAAGNAIAPTNGFPLLPSTDQLMDQASAETCVACLRKAVRYPDIAVSTSGKI